MKKFFLLAGLALSLGATMKADAQVRINVNIGNPMPVMQQSWYGNDCDYYYMPDQGVYYNVNRNMYVWPNGGNWMCGPALPPSYGNCSWGNSRYYSFRGRSPFMRNDYYRNYYGNRGVGGRPGYAYGNGRGPGGGWNGGGRGDDRWDNHGGGRGWNDNRGGRGGDQRWDNNRDDRRGGGDRNYGNNGGGNNGNGGNGGYNGNGGGNNGGGRGGWDRR